MRNAPAIVLLAIGFGCAAAQAPLDAHEPPAATAAATASPTHARTDVHASRTFGADATFGDVVTIVRELADQDAGDSDAGCLIARVGERLRFDADLLPAVRPLPDPTDDLGAVLAQRRGRVRVLSHWGQSGDGAHDLALASFTTLPPVAARAAPLAIVLTRAGVFLRYGDREATDADGPLIPDAVGSRLATAPAHVLYVTAEGDTPLDDVHALLTRLPRDRVVALSVALPAGTHIPDVAAAFPSTTRACPEGLPDLPEGTETGDLPVDAIVAALSPLRDAAAECLEVSGGGGGQVAIALRVGPDGRPRDACALEEPVGSAALTACVLSAARQLRFPEPTPRGFVDLHLPLALTPRGLSAQRPVCE